MIVSNTDLKSSTVELGSGGIVACRRAVRWRSGAGGMRPSDTPSTTDWRDSSRACCSASPATATSTKPMSRNSARQPSLALHMHRDDTSEDTQNEYMAEATSVYSD